MNPAEILPLVGMHFHPPAKDLIQVLPTGANLTLIPEPNNPYDEGNAVQVWVSISEVPESSKEDLEIAISGRGLTLDDMEEGSDDTPVAYYTAQNREPFGVWMLGFIAKTHNPGINDVLLADPESFPAYEAKLGFDMKGKPTVHLTWL